MLLVFRVQLNQAQDEIMKKKEMLDDLQPDTAHNWESCMAGHNPLTLMPNPQL